MNSFVSEFGSELDALGETLDQWIEENLSSLRVRKLDEARSVPPELWASLGELGFTSMLIPKPYGGADAHVRFDYEVIRRLGRRYASMAAGFMVVSMAARGIALVGTESQKQLLLPALASGTGLVSFGLTEPDTGTDLAAIRTSAKEKDGRWLVSGQKLYITLAADAKHLIVLARTDESRNGKRSDGLSLLIVPTDQPGVEVRRLKMSGLRAAGTTEVFLEEAIAIEREPFIGERGNGLRALLGTLNHERILQAFMAIGIAEAAWEDARSFALERKAFGRAIGAFQAVQHPLAETYIDIQASLMMSESAAEVEGSGLDSGLDAAMAKHHAGETAVSATDRAMRIQAAHGLTEESDLMRYHRDARDMVSGPISNEMARSFIAERCGLPRSY